MNTYESFLIKSADNAVNQLENVNDMDDIYNEKWSTSYDDIYKIKEGIYLKYYSDIEIVKLFVDNISILKLKMKKNILSDLNIVKNESKDVYHIQIFSIRQGKQINQGLLRSLSDNAFNNSYYLPILMITLLYINLDALDMVNNLENIADIRFKSQKKSFLSRINKIISVYKKSTECMLYFTLGNKSLNKANKYIFILYGIINTLKSIARERFTTDKIVHFPGFFRNNSFFIKLINLSSNDYISNCSRQQVCQLYKQFNPLCKDINKTKRIFKNNNKNELFNLINQIIKNYYQIFWVYQSKKPLDSNMKCLMVINNR